MTSKNPFLDLVLSTANQANHTAMVDTGATGHYLDAASEQHCINVQPTDTGPSVQVPNRDNLETISKRVIVPLAKELSDQAKVGHIFDSLKSGSLISSGQLCDDDCIALFTKFNVKIYKKSVKLSSSAKEITPTVYGIFLSLPKPLPRPQQYRNRTSRQSNPPTVPSIMPTSNKISQLFYIPTPSA